MRDFDPFHNKRLARRGFAQKLLGILGSAGLMGLHRSNRAGEKLKAVDYGYGIKVIRRTPAPVEEIEAPTVAETLEVVNLLAYTLEGTYWGSTDGLTWVDLTESSGADISASEHNCMIKHGSTIFWFESVSGSSKYQTTTDGQTWTTDSIGFSGGKITAAHSDGSTILVGFEDGSGEPVVYRSTDGGSSWGASTTLPFKSTSEKPVAFIKYPGTHGLVCGDGAIYRSTNNGSSWILAAGLADAVAVDFIFAADHFFGTDVFFIVGSEASTGKASYWTNVSVNLNSWTERGPFNDSNGFNSAAISNNTSSVWLAGDIEDAVGRAILREVPTDTVNSTDREGDSSWLITQANTVDYAILSAMLFAGGAPGQSMQYNLTPDDDTWQTVTSWSYGSETVVGIVELSAVS